ncbi:hypothetical protein TBLA_0C01780 [Henningerozyma blattae CBS 6284]|uniref:ABC transporter domain-containing protein n=1 Tax=Henningerozyma blattae (strain ATCC 34711 / CBS 6284 / DSM 70876 / NBRC 10599 / NRRL Y-10934 / UCD 77-7) TaxID=1071380 RepID=I2H0U0_HENB6|nr:hypothetical protein TBLA_0C01780 [Tetrapisispora blattae CBS 6284]CCH59992.1 hypothetical protein TBLA_0C01780 [Tetrapisispora blattae CBS 6284]
MPSARETLSKVLINLHSQGIGLTLQNITVTSYVKILFKHLFFLLRSNNTNLSIYRKRAKIILLSLSTVISLFGVTSVYTSVAIIKYIRHYLHDLKLSRNSPNSLKRTRSQLQLETGARIIYIPNEFNKKPAKPKRTKKGKPIYIPPVDDDIIDHNSISFKKFEIQENLIKKNMNNNNFNNKLFYSKFLNQLNILMKFLIPNFFSKNSIFLILQITFLILRTWLSLFIAKLDGQIVKDIISNNRKMFLWDILNWFLIAIPASFTNSSIKFLQRKLSLNFRINLTRYIHDIYLSSSTATSNLTFYKLNFDFPANNNSIVTNIDNSITNDIIKFSNTTTSIFANIAKPIIDLIFFAFYLRDNLGTFGVTGIFLNYFLTGYILKRFSPALNVLINRKSNSEGDYYNYHLNMINNSEEISFYQGTTVEKLKIKNLFNIFITNSLNIELKKLNYNIIEDYILKYTWSGLGYVFASIPIILSGNTNNVNASSSAHVDVNMKNFIVNKRLMLSLADAGSRLMKSIKEINQLTGYTNRIFFLLSVLHRVHSDKFDYGIDLKLIKQKQEQSQLQQIKGKKKRLIQPNQLIQGTIQNYFNGIRLENIDLIIPSKNGPYGTKLLKNLSFQIPDIFEFTSASTISTSTTNNNLQPFQSKVSSLLILGSNSCGKTSIQRIIAKLWPIYNKSGLLSIPTDDNLLFIPQKPYFLKGGTLRDQIIYPMSPDEFFDIGLNDKLLIDILTDVKLDYLIKRDQGWMYLDHIAEWKDLLSGGEKQRMNFARILFHRPKFIILDEATNAISIDMEDYLFNLLKRYRFNFVTISQRPSLIKYHDLLLEINHSSNSDDTLVTSTEVPLSTWKLQTVGTDEAINSIDNEILQLNEKLSHIEDWKLERDNLKKK